MSADESPCATSPTPSEQRAIERLLAELHDAWRRRDLDTYLAHFAEDADIVNRAGMWMRGTAEIRRQFSRLMERGLPEIFTATATVDAIRPVAPGVITVHERREEPARQSRATYVAVQADGRWQIESITIAPIEPSTDSGGHS